jgi:2',3'-cyclic-nucleotide 2'-phosphodiesterase (5'-nucleotidase family)
VRGRDIILILLMITTGLTAFGCGPVTQAQMSLVSTTAIDASAPTDTPIPGPSPIELTIVHTNDTRGYTEPCG